jgi:Tfp pilus assembly protein PilX
VKRENRGFILQISLFVLLVLSLVFVVFHQVTQQGQWTTHRFENSEITRLIAESAMAEALGDLPRKVRTREGSEFFSRHLPVETLPIQVPEANALARKMIAGRYEPAVQAFVQVIDYRDSRSQKTTFYPGEGIGRFSLTVQFSCGKKSPVGHQPSDLFMTRVHDFKISTLLSKRNNAVPRSCFAPNAILDYVLFLRYGWKEFVNQRGTNLNNQQVQFEIKQPHQPENFGKIYFGTSAANEQDEFVFANISPEWQEYLPKLPGNKPYQQTWTVDGAVCRQLIPQLEKDDPQGSLSPYLQGVFTATVQPISGNYQGPFHQEMQETIAALVKTAPTRVEANIDRPFQILGSDFQKQIADAMANRILEGTIRQRYLHFVTFHLDLSKLNPAVAAKMRLVDVPFPCYETGKSPDPETRLFHESLIRYLDGQGSGQERSRHVSHFVADYRLSPDQLVTPNPSRAFSHPTFFTYGGSPVEVSSPDFQPYSGCLSMVLRVFHSQKELEESGILDSEQGILNLNGMILLNHHLQLTSRSGKPLKIRGQGVLMTAPGRRNGGGNQMAGGWNITVNSGMDADDTDALCILCCTEGQIFVNTSDCVTASLIATGCGEGNPGIVFNRPFHIKGALATTILNSGDWKVGTNLLEYDPRLKSDTDVFQTTISPLLYFQRYAENHL